jgi:hypothetical protein
MRSTLDSLRIRTEHHSRGITVPLSLAQCSLATCFQSFPNVGGAAPDAQTVSLSFQVVGTPTETFS